MLLPTSVAGFAAACLLVGFILRKKKKGGDLVVWLFFIAGFGLSGVLGSLLLNIGDAIRNGVTAMSSAMFGEAIPTLAALGLTLWMALDMAPKSNTGNNAPWLALIVPSVWAVTGGPFAQLATTGDNIIAELATSVSTVATQVVAGI